LRFEQTYNAEEPFFVTSLPVVLATQLSAFAAFRVYQGVWRYTGVPDAVRLAKAVSAGCAASVITLLLLYRFEGYSRAVFVIDAALLLLFVAGARLSFRLLDEVFRHAPSDVRRVLIYGAGDGGVLALREMQGNHELGRVVVGFLDDDRWKQATLVRGVPVIGGLDQLAEMLEKHAIDEVVVASTRIPLHRLRTLADVCSERNISVVRASLVVSGAVAS
jgi:UDP-GlcNAc:undecaprenyl-phosphate GlcNAc-1-phosphate transferase